MKRARRLWVKWYISDTNVTFTFHRPPLAHQLAAFERFKDAPYQAHFDEQRTRKTKQILDKFRYRCDRDVDALIVIAYPNGVHRVWIDELTKDFPPDFLARTRALAWASGKTTKGRMREAALALRAHPGPIVFTMNCEAIITEAGWKYLEWLLKKRRVMLVADESSWMAGFSARTKKALALSRRPNVVIKAILDGTPCDESPIELYHQTEFLHPGLLGFNTKTAYRAYYTEYQTDADGVMVKGRRYNKRTGKVDEYPIITGYRNLDELQDKLKSFSTRVLRSDVSDAPRKTYQTRYFALTARQRKVYDRLRDEYVAELSSGAVPVANVLDRMTKLQMICRNFYPPDRTAYDCAACFGSSFLDDGSDCAVCGGIGAIVEAAPLERIDPERNPAAEALVEELRVTRGPAVVWCRFRQDVEDASAAAVSVGRTTYRFYGAMPEAAREAAYQAFRGGTENEVIVGTITSGLSRGRDLSRATTLIYFSNDFSLRARGQSEDRAESLDRTISTDVIDLVAEDTRDLDIIEALRNKRSLAALVTGDRPEEWL